jgi:hypothetical protein
MSDISPAPSYIGPERRQAALTEDRVQLMISTALASAMQAHEAKIIAHMDGQFAQLRSVFASAFPDGDVHGHRMAHERKIRDADGWAKLKAEVLSKFLTAGLWVAAGWLALAAWEAFKHEVRK